jgi:hypothetical protein
VLLESVTPSAPWFISTWYSQGPKLFVLSVAGEPAKAAAIIDPFAYESE